ncbi:MAG: hypothetical protein U0Y68_10635 [Blastocatellia bacterium]
MPQTITTGNYDIERRETFCRKNPWILKRLELVEVVQQKTFRWLQKEAMEAGQAKEEGDFYLPSPGLIIG